MPKVSRPVLATDAHWTAGGGEATAQPAAGPLTSTYTPDADSAEDNDDGADNDKVPAREGDLHGSGRRRREDSVQVVLPSCASGARRPTNQAPRRSMSLLTSLRSGPRERERGHRGRYTGYRHGRERWRHPQLRVERHGADATSFKINIMTGQITVAMPLDHEAGRLRWRTMVCTNSPLRLTTRPMQWLLLVPPGLLRDDGHVTITATNVNEAPKVTVDPESKHR